MYYGNYAKIHFEFSESDTSFVEPIIFLVFYFRIKGVILHKKDLIELVCLMYILCLKSPRFIKKF